MKAVLFLLFALVAARCSDNSITPLICHEGVVIGKIRSAGGGIAISMKDSTFSNHEWNGFNNVVEALNVPHDLEPGKTIYFFARVASEDEGSFPISADGNESDKPLIYILDFSSVKCPAIKD